MWLVWLEIFNKEIGFVSSIEISLLHERDIHGT
jgi:hypothetical protein